MNRFAGHLVRMLIVTALLQGCAVPSEPRPVATDDARAAVSSLPVAVDLVSVLVQLDGYSPYDTTIQVNAPTGEFGNRLLETLEIAGYGLQTVSADQGSNYLAYGSSAIQTESGPQTQFEMRLGFISISRQLRNEGGHYIPTSPITVRAAVPGPVALNGAVYVARPGAPLLYPSGVRFLDSDGSLLSDTTFRYAWYPTGATVGNTEESALEPARFLRQATGRLYDRGQDDSALGLRPASDFRSQKTLTIRFPGLSDELLGQGNRNALETLVGYFDVERDRMTILSCAPDRSRSDSSVARSSRVKSELLTLNVPGAQVLELGCPDGTKRSVARAGLLVTLERLRPGAPVS